MFMVMMRLLVFHSGDVCVLAFIMDAVSFIFIGLGFFWLVLPSLLSSCLLIECFFFINMPKGSASKTYEVGDKRGQLLSFRV